MDVISLSEALLVRFRSDGTMVSKGFSASYLALDPFEGSEEETYSESSEMSTPFPGYLKSIYVKNEDEEDYSEYENYNRLKYKHHQENEYIIKQSEEQYD